MEVNMPMLGVPHVQLHPAVDMVAQHGSNTVLSQGSNIDSRPTQTQIAPFAAAMAAAAGPHDPAALTADSLEANGTAPFDLSVSPSDARMASGSRL